MHILCKIVEDVEVFCSSVVKSIKGRQHIVLSKGFISDFNKVAIEAVRPLCLGDFRDLVENQLEILLHTNDFVLALLYNLKH